MNLKQVLLRSSLLLTVICWLPVFVIAQNSVTILTGADLNRVVPPGFYFQGLSAPTQMRNSAAARFGTKRFVITGLVDTSGYAADVRAKYEGFFLTDSSVSINGSDLAREHTDLVLVMTGRCRLWTAAQIKFSRSQRQRIMN